MKTHITPQGLAASAVALLVGLAFFGVATAQEGGGGAQSGLVVGLVNRCTNGVGSPARGVAVGVEGGGQRLAFTNEDGEFFLALPAGTYTVTALGEDGSLAIRPYVPVEVGVELNIGILDLGGGVAGCSPDSQITDPVLPTFTPTALPTPVPPTATPIPLPTATPVPVPAAPTEEMVPTEEMPPTEEAPPAE